MSKKDEITNIVWLAGKLKFRPNRKEKVVTAIVDIGMHSGVQVGVFIDKETTSLYEKLLKFEEGDFIKLVCFLEPYGIKQADNSWRNGIGIRITNIKNDPPVRATLARGASDDDVPF